MKKASEAVVKLAGMLCILAMLAACGSSPAETSNANADPAAAAGNQAGGAGANAGNDAEDGAAGGRASEQPVKVRFSEVIRSIFYAPHYAAMDQGFFAEQGLEIDMNTAQGSDKGAAALIAGTADISLVGPETAIYIYNQEGDDKIKIFYQLTTKDGSFLLSREPVENFAWSDLAGRTVIGWRPGSAPQMVMSAQLAKEGVEGVEVVTNLAAPAMAGAFTSGQGDFIQLFEPVASTLVQEGAAHYVTSMGEAFGDFPETSYVATADYIAAHPDVIQRFVQAVAMGTKWLETASDDEIVAALSPFFEGTSDELILQSIARYQEQGTWADPQLTESQFATLQDVLVGSGVLEDAQRVDALEQVADMQFVEKIE
ncbi:ABC transporter substrate-binding protein [Paenibacillus sp. IB182496]|uniref:ABC transporter substrate-binding protein n=1 Tax=Paenibacillus sabuli TaxID=2772509 RepID=A0A927BSI0_9BACL|nr:ABC transporter substrate-binding protein [Paenibacillus sabuli]MBD2844955.1 ABC transporter substrate-binding protein [Paenibacillus sabuli]